MADIAWGKYHRPCIFILPIPLPHPPSLLLSLLLSHGLQAKLFPFPFPFYGIYDWRLCRFLYVHIILSFLPSNVNVSRDMSHPRPSSSPSHSLLQKVGAKGKKGGKKNLVKYTIDCNQPVDDKVLDMSTFEKFLKDRIKVCCALPSSLSVGLEEIGIRGEGSCDDVDIKNR